MSVHVAATAVVVVDGASEEDVVVSTALDVAGEDIVDVVAVLINASRGHR